MSSPSDVSIYRKGFIAGSAQAATPKGWVHFQTLTRARSVRYSSLFTLILALAAAKQCAFPYPWSWQPLLVCSMSGRSCASWGAGQPVAGLPVPRHWSPQLGPAAHRAHYVFPLLEGLWARGERGETPAAIWGASSDRSEWRSRLMNSLAWSEAFPGWSTSIRRPGIFFSPIILNKNATWLSLCDENMLINRLPEMKKHLAKSS